MKPNRTVPQGICIAASRMPCTHILELILGYTAIQIFHELQSYFLTCISSHLHTDHPRTRLDNRIWAVGKQQGDGGRCPQL